MQHGLRSLSLASALLVGPSALAAVHVVTGGPGGAFGIVDAVAAAADGDTILVKAGVYSGFTVDAKSLTIVAEQGASVSTIWFPPFGISAEVYVQNLTHSQRVVLRGIDAPIRFSSSAGAIRVEDAEILGTDGYCEVPFSGPSTFVPGEVAANVFQCASVSFVGCRIVGGNGGEQSAFAPCCTAAGHGLVVTASNVALYDTTVAGGTVGQGCADGAAIVDPNGGVEGPLAPGTRFAASSPTRKGESGTLTFEGLPGDGVLLFLSPGTGHVSLPFHQGVLLVGPVTGVFSLGALDATGKAAVPFQVNDLPPAGVGAVDVHLQAAYLSAAGAVLAPSSVLTLLDPSI